MKRAVKIGTGVIVGILILNVVLVLVQGVSLKYWVKLGFPNAAKVLQYRLDEYPGHSLECIRFPEKLMEGQEDGSVLVYSEEGTGIDCNGYNVHIGDTREEVKEQFIYDDPDGDGSEYELGCYFCETGFLTFSFEYDENDTLTNMKITIDCLES